MEEVWKDVGIIKGVDYTGLYQVSNYGEVKSLNYRGTGKEGILTPIKDRDGYLSVSLYKNGNSTKNKIHRIIGLTFIPIPYHLKHIPIEELDVEHIDTNKENNRLDNLRWNTHKGNMENPITRQKRIQSIKGEHNPFYGKHHTEETKHKLSETKKGKKLSEEHKRKIGESHKGIPKLKLSKPVLQINKDTNEVIAEFFNINEVEKQLGYNHSHISKCCLGKSKTAYEYKWQYKPINTDL